MMTMDRISGTGAFGCYDPPDRRQTRGAMADTTLRDRSACAIMGIFIDHTLGLGPHWYYGLAELRRDYGKWINGSTDPRSD